jgi:hypothetical protein
MPESVTTPDDLTLPSMLDQILRNQYRMMDALADAARYTVTSKSLLEAREETAKLLIRRGAKT